MSCQKIKRIQAKKLAYYNAVEFIRGHGEEGGIEEDIFGVDVDLYLKEMKKLANKLERQGDKIIIPNS